MDSFSFSFLCVGIGAGGGLCVLHRLVGHPIRHAPASVGTTLRYLSAYRFIVCVIFRGKREVLCLVKAYNEGSVANGKKLLFLYTRRGRRQRKCRPRWIPNRRRGLMIPSGADRANAKSKSGGMQPSFTGHGAVCWRVGNRGKHGFGDFIRWAYSPSD